MQERCRVWCKITILCDLIEQKRKFFFSHNQNCVINTIFYLFPTEIQILSFYYIFSLHNAQQKFFARYLQTNIHSLEMPFFKDHSWDLPFLIKSPQSLSPLFIKMSPFWSRDYAVMLMYRVWRLKDDAILRRWSQKTHTCRRWSIISSPSPVV